MAQIESAHSGSFKTGQKVASELNELWEYLKQNDLCAVPLAMRCVQVYVLTIFGAQSNHFRIQETFSPDRVEMGREFSEVLRLLKIMGHYAFKKIASPDFSHFQLLNFMTDPDQFNLQNIILQTKETL